MVRNEESNEQHSNADPATSIPHQGAIEDGTQNPVDVEEVKKIDDFVDATGFTTDLHDVDEIFVEPEEQPDLTVHELLEYDNSPSHDATAENSGTRDWVVDFNAVTSSQGLEEIILDIQRTIERVFPREKGAH